MYSGGSNTPILGYGDVQIRITTPDGIKPFTLKEVAWAPSFHTNVVSFQRMQRAGIQWDTENNALTYQKEPYILLDQKYGQYVIEYNEAPNDKSLEPPDSNDTVPQDGQNIHTSDEQEEEPLVPSELYPTPDHTAEPTQPGPSHQRRSRIDYGPATKKSNRIAGKPPISYTGSFTAFNPDPLPRTAIAAFATGTIHRTHRKDPPPEPRKYREQHHPYGSQACRCPGGTISSKA